MRMTRVWHKACPAADIKATELTVTDTPYDYALGVAWIGDMGFSVDSLICLVRQFDPWHEYTKSPREPTKEDMKRLSDVTVVEPSQTC